MLKFYKKIKPVLAFSDLGCQTSGIFLAYDGISNLWTISRLSKFERAAVQAMKDAEAVDVVGEIVEDSAEK